MQIKDSSLASQRSSAFQLVGDLTLVQPVRQVTAGLGRIRARRGQEAPIALVEWAGEEVVLKEGQDLDESQNLIGIVLEVRKILGQSFDGLSAVHLTSFASSWVSKSEQDLDTGTARATYRQPSAVYSHLEDPRHPRPRNVRSVWSPARKGYRWFGGLPSPKVGGRLDQFVDGRGGEFVEEVSYMEMREAAWVGWIDRGSFNGR